MQKLLPTEAQILEIARLADCQILAVFRYYFNFCNRVRIKRRIEAAIAQVCPDTNAPK